MKTPTSQPKQQCLSPGQHGRPGGWLCRSCTTGGLLLALASCSGMERLQPVAPRGVQVPAATLSLSSPAVVRPDEVTPELRQWLEEQTFPSQAPYETLRHLLTQMRSPRGLGRGLGLGLRYASGYTGTAQEVFDSGSFNCLSFSYLLVAFARELGLPAYYMRAGDVFRYEKAGDLVVGTTHATVGFGSGPERWVLEFGVGPTVDYRLAQPVSDEVAVALYYANRGAEELQVGEVEAGREWLATAVGLAPGLADAWLNYGVALRRGGDLAGAESAYRLAIELAPDFASPYHNLALLLRLEGRRDASREMFALLDQRKTRNPYIYLDLGDLSFEDNDLAEAARLYRRAVRLGGDSAEIHAALGLLEVSIGNIESARRRLVKGRKLDPAQARVVVLETALESLD